MMPARSFDRLFEARFTLDQVIGLAVVTIHAGILTWIAISLCTDHLIAEELRDYSFSTDASFFLIVGSMHLAFVVIGERLFVRNRSPLVPRLFLPLAIVVSAVLQTSMFRVAVGWDIAEIDYYDTNPTARRIVFTGLSVLITFCTVALIVAQVMFVVAARRAHAASSDDAGE